MQKYLKILSLFMCYFFLLSFTRIGVWAQEDYLFKGDSSIAELSSHYYPAGDTQTKKYGYIDQTGTWIIPPVFDQAWDFSGGFARVDMGEISGLIDKNGKWVYRQKKNPSLDELTIVSDVSDGLAQFKLNGRYGYMTPYGECVIPPYFKNTLGFSNGFAAVQVETVVGEKWGFINLKGEWVVAPIYDEVKSFSEGLACVCQQGLYGYIDSKGEVIVPLNFLTVDDFRNGLAVVQYSKNISENPHGDPGVIDKRGNWVIWPQPQLVFLENCSTKNKIAFWAKGSREWLFYGLIDSEGTWLLPPVYEYSKEFSEGLCIQPYGSDLNGRLYGYIDMHGNWNISPIYYFAEEFEGGLAKVIQNIPIAPLKLPDGKIATERRIAGYINKEGNWIFKWQISP